MTQSIKKRGLGWLIAAIVLVGSVTPPGVRHSHADGERPHDHSHRHDHHGHVHHWHGHTHSHHFSDHQDSSEPASAHVHFWVFGWIVTIPSSSAPGDSEGDDSDCTKLIYLVQTDQANRQHNQVWDKCLLDSQTAVTEYDAARLQTLPVRSPPVKTPPLCDSARFERSGVLLI